MTAPISFTVRPPTSSAPHRPSPLVNGSRSNSRVGPPSRRLFENGNHSDSDEDDFGRDERRSRDNRSDRRDEQRDGKSAASGSSKPSAPLVIAALPNRDWRESSSRRVPNFRPEAPKREASDLITHERIGDGPAKVGLERFGKKRDQADEDVRMEVKQEEGMEEDRERSSSPKIKAEPLSLDEQALQELLAGETEKESAEDRAQRELVIAMQANNVRVLSESEALQRDIQALPEESTLEDFEAVPISAFGIAALRGMGWDPKSTENVKAREVQRRPQLLGLGATPLEVSLPPGSGKSRKELEREKEKREKKKSRDEKTGRGFSAASLLMKTKTPTPGGTPSGSGRGTPVQGSRAGSVETGTGTESDGSRRRRREDEGGSERESKRRDDRDREDRYETEEERARRKAKERERYDRGDRYERSDRDRDRDRDRRDRDRDRDRGGRDDDRDRRRERY